MILLHICYTVISLCANAQHSVRATTGLKRTRSLLSHSLIWDSVEPVQGLQCTRSLLSHSLIWDSVEPVQGLQCTRSLLSHSLIWDCGEPVQGLQRTRSPLVQPDMGLRRAQPQGGVPAWIRLAALCFKCFDGWCLLLNKIYIYYIIKIHSGSYIKFSFWKNCTVSFQV